MNVYIAATRQNDGKTMVCLGLLTALKNKVEFISYMKPVGQQYQVINDEKIDKDVILMTKIFGFKNKLSDMSPIAIPAGFTENYILNGNREELAHKVCKAYSELASSSEFVLIEGTGHAGVGSVFDMSNADVASLIGAKVIIVSNGGIGKPIDEIMLNYAKFESKGVEVLGVIVNKVHEEKFEKINDLVRKGLARQNIEVFGVIPFKQVLSNPMVSEVLEDLEGELICGKGGLSNVVEHFIIGDFGAFEALEYVSGGTLLITPGNREDFIFSALSGWVLGVTRKYHISGIISTYGKRPSEKVIEVVERANVPLIMVNEDSFTAASQISSMIFKLRAEDQVKIQETQALIAQYVNVDRIFDVIKSKR